MAEIYNLYRSSPETFTLTVEYLSVSPNGDVMPLATITDSDLIFTQAAVSNDPATGVSYTVAIDFSWRTYNTMWNYEDKVVVAWGGNLYQTSKSAYVRYYYPGTSAGTWGDYSSQRNIQYTETAVNAGGYYSFAQFYPSSSSISVKYGSIMYTLAQANATATTQTKVLAQYARQAMQTTGSINISGSGPSVSIAIGTGYNTSKQVSTGGWY